MNVIILGLVPWLKTSTVCLVPGLRMTSSFTNSLGARCRLPSLPPNMAKVYVPGQMFKYQDTVKRLPVMPLDYILDKYVKSVEPLLSENEFTTTRNAVAKFREPGGVGEVLHKQLVDRSQKFENWLSDWWNYYAYLSFRDPVIINVSPAIAYPLQKCSNRDEYLRISTRFLEATLRYLMIVLSESIPPVLYRGNAQCMSQYWMGGCRIPGEQADTLRRNFPPEKRHVIIIRKGHFYKLDVFCDTPAGEVAVVPANFLMEQLKWILNDAKDRNPYPVGVLTTEQRDQWFQARERLRKDPLNCMSCDAIENAVYGISLDESHDGVSGGSDTFCEQDAKIVALRTLHGNGTGHNTSNRWFDLTSQLILGEDGGFGSILEHSAMDGPAAISTNIFVLEFIKSGYNVFAEKSPIDSSALKQAERLQWNLSDESIRDIENAKMRVDKSLQNVDMAVVIFEQYGKDLPKSVKLSPDGFVQSAIQLAYYKLYGKTTATYESGSIRWFKYGRTDTIRSCTNASHNFVKTMTDPTASEADKFDSLTAAVKAHSEYTNDAISGKGIDRHLLGMKILAGKKGLPVPQLYNDIAYERSMHFCLSTSQVPVAGHDIFLCFGPVVTDGYGVCYNPQENKILLCVTSFHDHPDTDSFLFANKLQESFEEMKNTIEQSSKTTAKL